MTNNEAIALFGTTEPVEPPVILRAGALQAELEGGNLRHIRIGGFEAIRAVSFIVRDRNWGTYTPAISDLRVDQQDDGFTVSYTAMASDDTQSFRYRASIEGRPNRISFRAEGETPTGFDTSRTGFVVLHPINGVAGSPVTAEHTDGRTVQDRFPDRIDPVQPFLDLRALTHTVAPGVTVTCRMEGDAYEMEDQRNWCDASYKTYVRPLAKPWPYRIAPGDSIRQSVTVDIEGQAPSQSAQELTVITLGEAIGPAPALGIGFDPAQAEATRRVMPQLADLHPAMLVCHFDPRQGHNEASLEAALAVAEGLGAEPWLEAVIASVDEFEAEIATLAELVQSLESRFRAVLLTPAADLKSTTPGQPWPPSPPPAAFYKAARGAFPDVRLGGGMASSFTELNRKRPPLDDLDFVGFTTMALVHASDDVSVLEGLEALPAIARSAQAIAGHLPLVVGPSAIGLRLNPYGSAPVPNPDNKRQAMALNDPRQRAQLGAAWASAYYARLAAEGVQAIVLGGTTGPFGVVHTQQTWPTPGFESEGAPYPIFHAVRELTQRKGATLRRVHVSNPAQIEALGFESETGSELLVVNLTASAQSVQWGDRIEDLPPYGSAILRAIE